MFELFEMHTGLKPGAQMFLRFKWRKLETVSLWLVCFCVYSCVVYLNLFFLSVGPVLDWGLLVFQCYGNVWNWTAKLIWPRTGIFWWFSKIKLFYRQLRFYPHGLKSAKNALVYLSFDYRSFFRCLIWGLFWSVFQMWHRFSKNDCWASAL